MERGSFIYLLPFGGLKEVELQEVVKEIRVEFGIPVKVHNCDIDPEPFYDTSRKQYHSTGLLKRILELLPSDAVKAVGLVPFDLFIPILTFVFGEAQLDGRVAIVSTARLRQEYYGLPSNPRLLHRRLIKEIKHELGHTFGLVHCSLRECVMSVANSVSDVDSKGITFCEGCKETLRQKLRDLSLRC
ncbi:MAG: hypothetical protein DRG40_06230 [Deltaproteobacteria bacterium]|nr:MAG: hypothetical protein DRG40_06230 [Deltaproteobacteria bacterium]